MKDGHLHALPTQLKSRFASSNSVFFRYCRSLDQRPFRCKRKIGDAARAVGCSHVSGLLTRRLWQLALLKSVDRIATLLNAYETPGPEGFSDPRFDRFVITSHPAGGRTSGRDQRAHRGSSNLAALPTYGYR